MPTADLKRASIEVNDGLDAIVIVNDLGDVPGGRTLDVSGLATDVEVIRSGHILIQNDTTKAVKPLGVTSEAYDTLPEGHSYLGVLKASVLKKDPRAAILTIGQVNAAGQTILMVTHSVKAASHAGRVLFLRDGEVYHQLYRGAESREALFRRISDTLTVLTQGGENHG